MFETKVKEFMIYLCLFIALMLNLYYLSNTHFEFMLSLSHFRMFNVSALSYTFMRLIYAFLPLFLLIKEYHWKKCNVLRTVFYAMGILYFLGSSWVIYLMADGKISLLNNLPELRAYLSSKALNFDYLVWDTYDLYGILFSLIQGISYILLASFIQSRRKISIRLFWLTVANSIILPFLYVFVISGNGQFSTLWLQKSTFLFLSGVFSGVALTVAGTSRFLWADIIKPIKQKKRY